VTCDKQTKLRQDGDRAWAFNFDGRDSP